MFGMGLADFDVVAFLEVLATTAVAVVGYLLVTSVKSQIGLKVAEERMKSYGALWDQMLVASPTRTVAWQKPLRPLTAAERKMLFDAFTEWYYKDGHGMLLGGATRSIYLDVKDNLICPISELTPLEARKRLADLPEDEQDWERGKLSIEQMSLLRTRMKADLEVFGPTYHTGLSAEGKAFLRACSEDPTDKPWTNLR